jgi:hypothetical protein
MHEAHALGAAERLEHAARGIPWPCTLNPCSDRGSRSRRSPARAGSEARAPALEAVAVVEEALADAQPVRRAKTSRSMLPKAYSVRRRSFCQCARGRRASSRPARETAGGPTTAATGNLALAPFAGERKRVVRQREAALAGGARLAVAEGELAAARASPRSATARAFVRACTASPSRTSRMRPKDVSQTPSKPRSPFQGRARAVPSGT